MKRIALFLSSLSILHSDPFDPNRLQVFHEDFTYNQAEIVYKDFLKERIPVQGDVIPPEGLLNHTPLVITNRSGLSADHLYVIGKGQKVDDLNALFLEPDLTTGICSLVSPSTNNSADPNISVKLSSLPSAGPDSYFLYVPQMISGRFYISVDRPLYMKTGTRSEQGETITTIDDPSQTTTQDPNYYTLYQNFEFTLDKSYELYANVSNVDFFSLPLQLSSHTFPSGDLYPTLDNLTVVGYPETSSRSSILQGLKNETNQTLTPSNFDTKLKKNWNKLSVPFYKNPYESNPSVITDLRYVSAKTSIALEKGYLFKGGNTSATTFFDKDYLSNFENSYYSALFEYYSNGKKLDFKIFPAQNESATYSLTADSSSLILNLSLVQKTGGEAAPKIIKIDLNNLSTEALLGGDVGVWVKENVFNPNKPDPWQTEISKAISALFTAGFLPYDLKDPNDPSKLAQPVLINDTFLSKFRSQLFTNPSDLKGGPWFNVYDKVVHKFLVKTGGVGLGYAFDYDDLLGIAGLLHVRVQTDGVLNPDQPYSILTLGPIDTVIPDPTVDFGPYSLTINPKAADSNDILIEYTKGDHTEKTYIPVDSSSPVTIGGLKNEFKVLFKQEGDETLEYIVYPKYQLVLPVKTRYNEQDVKFMNGIVFTHATDKEITISLPPNK